MNLSSTCKISLYVAILFIASCNATYFEAAYRIGDIEEAKIKYTKVVRLDLSNLQLDELPTDLKKFTNLRSINLSNNPELNIEKVFQSLSELLKLELIILDSNHIEKIPENISSIKLLSHLSLVNNPELDLPFLVENLQYSTLLKSLNLSSNDIRKLPESFNRLSTITNLRFSNNAINTADDFVVLGKMKSLSLLWLDANNIKELPSSIGHLKIKELYLDNNFISKLPKEISGCGNLRVLHLGENKFTELPKEVIIMPKLYFLSLNKNEISVIPNEFGSSKFKLSALILDDNELSEDQITRAKKYFSGFFLLSL